MVLFHQHPERQAGHMTDCIYHAVIFACTMLVLGIAAFVLDSWGWFIAAGAGWGMVLLAQVLYVFVWESAGADPAQNSKAVEKMAQEARAITPNV